MRILPIATALLWIANLGYVAGYPQWHGMLQLSHMIAVQLFALGAALAVTTAWLLHRRGIEYRIGYRQGRADR
ncbi:hypothetical protein [Nonomuraea sp. NPDC050643]|uniref:hypothetical protein n=1 Tax=Nonomuraea sp. NPDC050643 TaxID=3155660 RepID=UPI00340E1B02